MEKLTNNDIKLIRSLKEKKFRDEYGLFIVEGEKLVAEALRSGFEIVRTVRCGEDGEALMRKLSLLNTPSPALAVVKKAPEAVHGTSGLCLALDAIRDPGNMGTILRLADWFALDCVFASPDCVDIYNPKVVQASMGAVFRVKTVYCDIASKCREFREDGKDVFGTFLDGGNIYRETLPREGLIVMGNEASGIGAPVAEECTRRLTIPDFGGGSESLNVAVAAAITISEFRRNQIL